MSIPVCFIASPFEQQQQQQQISNSVKYSKWIFYSDALIRCYWCCCSFEFSHVARSDFFRFGLRFSLVLIKFRPNWVNHHAVNTHRSSRKRRKFSYINSYIYICWWWQIKSDPNQMKYHMWNILVFHRISFLFLYRWALFALCAHSQLRLYSVGTTMSGTFETMKHISNCW